MKKNIIILFLITSFLYLNFNLGNNYANLSGNLKPNSPEQTIENWYKGNTHTHTTNSDGDTSPEKAVQWFKDHGYNFLVITDHNFLTKTEPLDTDKDDEFILIPGEEISSKGSLHLNALGIKNVIPAATGENKLEIIQKNVDNTRKDDGVPIISHPNFHWAVSAEIMKKIKNCNLFELFNGHPSVNNFGGGGFPGTEEMWDEILNSGKKIYGVASDDAHGFQGEFSKDRSNPGRAWIWVKAKRLTAEDILDSMEKGKFYSSTGVALKDVVIKNKRIEIYIQPKSDFKYTTFFIGNGGKIFKKSYKNPAIYNVEGDEKYVRAKVISSNGRTAWIQPIFFK